MGSLWGDGDTSRGHIPVLPTADHDNVLPTADHDNVDGGDLDASIDVVSRLARGFRADVLRLRQENEAQLHELTLLKADVVQFERRAIRAEEEVESLTQEVRLLRGSHEAAQGLEQRVRRAAAILDLSLPDPPEPPRLADTAMIAERAVQN